MSLTPQLVIMVKAPRLGRVKTRLGGDIGAVGAWRFYRTVSQALIRRLSTDPRWQTVLAVSPDSAVGQAGLGPENIPHVAQGPGNLGARMGRLMRDLPPGPVVIIGTDIPAINADHIAEAFARLGHDDAVFGPAHDGGYWLVGLKRRPRVLEIFANVRWSTAHALADTMANLKGLKVSQLPMLSDVDTGDDYRAWRKAERQRRTSDKPPVRQKEAKARPKKTQALDAWFTAGRTS